MLLHGHHVRQDLGGVVQIGQTVEHRHTGVFGQVQNDLLIKTPVFDAVEEAAQNLGRVLQGFLLAHLGGAGVQVGDVAALFLGRYLEGAAGAGRGFFKQQHDILALEGLSAQTHTLFGL